MRNLATAILVVTLLVMPYSNAEAKQRLKRNKGYDIYLLIGQSNMAGRGRLLATDTLHNIKGVWLLNDKDMPEPARNPLNKYSTIRKGYKMQQMSPGYSFATKLHAKTGRKILLVHNARGGTRIGWWQPESDHAEPNYYNEAVRRTKRAMRYGTLRAILWHQGCGDNNSQNRALYMERLQRLAAALRRDLNAPNVPFIAGELAYWQYMDMNNIIRTISEHIPNSTYVSAEGCDMLKDESDPHFGRAGQLLLGSRYADKVLSMVYGHSTEEN